MQCHALSILVVNRCRGSAHYTVQDLWVQWKSAYGRPHFPYGIKEITVAQVQWKCMCFLRLSSSWFRCNNKRNKLPLVQLFFYSKRAPSRPGSPQCRGFTIALRNTTLGMTPLDEWSARRRGLYLTTRNTHRRQTSMHSL